MYADTVEPGIATVKVIGIGRYTGTIEGEYRIIVKPFWKRFIIDAE